MKRHDSSETQVEGDEQTRLAHAADLKAALERGDLKTVEAWAEEKGMLPQLRTGPGRVGRIPAEAERPNPEYAKFAAAKALRAWPVGKEVTEEEFDKAVAEAMSVEVR